MSQYWWGSINKPPKCLPYLSHLSKVQPRKPDHTAPGFFYLPNRPFRVWQMDFTQLPLNNRYKYVFLKHEIWNGYQYISQLLVFFFKNVQNLSVPNDVDIQ